MNLLLHAIWIRYHGIKIQSRARACPAQALPSPLLSFSKFDFGLEIRDSFSENVLIRFSIDGTIILP